MAHECAACKCASEPQDTPNTPAPKGWFIRCIDSTDYVLCDVCGHQSQFCGGISPYLVDRLELEIWATCDLSSEALALGVKRRRGRKRSKTL